MGRFDGKLGPILAVLSGFVLVALATLALATGVRGPGRETVGGRAARQAEPTQEKPAPPDEGIRESYSTPIPEERARAIATANARRYTGPRSRGPALIHRASPSIENLDSQPSIFIATVEGKGTGLRLSRYPDEVHTPLDLRIERVLVDEIDPPAGFRYVGYGGTTADGYTEVVAGMHPELEVGRRYVFYTVPLTREGGEYDPRYMTVNYAMPIDAEGRVEDIAAGGKRVKVALAEAIERIRRGAAEARWSPVR